MTCSAPLPTRRHATNFGDEFSSTPREKKFFQGRHKGRVKVIKRLGDDDRIPSEQDDNARYGAKYFGKYQGVKLREVPNRQLDRWREASWIEDLFPDVWDYISRAAADIDRELDHADRDSRW
jgi:hypothetical protein